MNHNALHYRLISTTKKDPLIRAAGLNKRHDLKILDCTGGLGYDTLVMAYFGAKLTVLEESNSIYVKLISNLALAQTWDLEKALHIHSEHAEALTWIEEHGISLFDVIYCDPMFPAKKKSAKPKKTMQMLSKIAEKNEEKNTHLIETLIQLAPKKLVVKRPKSIPPDSSIHHSIHGKSHRFDIFLKK